ncbi:MAG: CPBP family intramembrane metalloprotease [Prevotella sp.]|nr:CPBP family intramembrane metalloprotease [Prevotella sp.]
MIYTVVFLAIQLVAGAAVQTVWTLIKGNGAQLDATGVTIMMAVVSILTLCMFFYERWAEVSPHWIRTRPWLVLFWCVLAAIGVIIPSSWFQEMLPELPNWAENDFDMILRSRIGYFVVGLMAPLAEEVVFRGAVLRALLRWNSRPWGAIALSALLFSAAHMNPAQFPHTFLVGLLLGWLYYRTDSIIPGIVYHWVNNTIAYVLYNLYPNPDIKLLDLFGGNERTMLMAIAFSLCILLPSLYQLHLNMKK